jgi:hypothetical protein
LSVGIVNAQNKPADQAPDSTRFYIYSDKFDHGYPSGYMGEKNGSSIKADGKWTQDPFSGTNCFKVTVTGTESWAGVYIQNGGTFLSMGGNKMRLANLTGYDKLVFYARSEKVMTLDAVGMGETSEPTEKLSGVDIGTKWKKYEIKVKGMDLSKINGLFYFVFTEAGTVYFDEIYYEKAPKK